jgi:ubiquinone/menaquinone biosynthesis C-methylase UbiE
MVKLRVISRLSRSLILSILCALVLGVVIPAQTIDTAGEFERLENRLFKAYSNRQYSEALEIATRMHSLRPDHADTLFNIASIYSRLGNKTQAFEWFEKAVDSGGLRSYRMERVEQYIGMLERKDRATFQKPERVMRALSLKPGERVADIGAGSGYFTIPVAKAVMPGGTVLAIDIEQAMLNHIEGRVAKEGLDNVSLRLVPNDDPQLAPKSVDTILMVDTYHYIENRSEYAKKLRAGLANGGRVVIIDYIPKSWKKRPWGPLPSQQVSRKTVDKEMADAGLVPIRVHNFLPEQYFVEYQVR